MEKHTNLLSIIGGTNITGYLWLHVGTPTSDCVLTREVWGHVGRAALPSVISVRKNPCVSGKSN